MAYAAVTPRPALSRWSGRLHAALKGALVLVAFAALGGLMWYSYAEGARDGGRRIAPVIRAAAGPIKTRPAEPGGLRIPHRDKRIYDRIAPERRKKPSGTVERLIPRPDPVAIAPKRAATGAAKPKPRSVARPVIKGGPARARVFVARKRRRPVAKGKLVGKPILKAPRRRYAAGPMGFRIQIAAYPTPQLAARRWERLVGRHKDLIGRLDWYVEKVERGNGRGPLYRLQLGPLKNRKAAKDLCAKLGKRKVSCLFVKG
jgi:hypothetical protein